MSDDADHVLLTLQRGERGELRLSRSRYQGKVFTKLQIWYPSDDELKPGRQVVTIRDHELDDVLAALAKIAAKIAGAKEPTRGRRPKHTERRDDDRQQTLATERRYTPEELDEVF